MAILNETVDSTSVRISDALRTPKRSRRARATDPSGLVYDLYTAQKTHTNRETNSFGANGIQITVGTEMYLIPYPQIEVNPSRGKTIFPTTPTTGRVLSFIDYHKARLLDPSEGLRIVRIAQRALNSDQGKG